MQSLSPTDRPRTFLETMEFAEKFPELKAQEEFKFLLADLDFKNSLTGRIAPSETDTTINKVKQQGQNRLKQ